MLLYGRKTERGDLRVRIHNVLSEAQDGHAFANVARAFHLPPAKVDVAVGIMLEELVGHIERRMQARRSLPGLVELLGQSGYEQVLETPALLGATHTQVLGNDALKFIAGRTASDKMAQQAAAAAGISEMISEYLLPVIAAMLVGALAKTSRAGLETIMNGDPEGPDPDPPADDRGGNPALYLPRVSGGVGFSGSTGGAVGFGSPAAAASAYLELAEDIRRAERTPGMRDPAAAVRRLLAASLGTSVAPTDWMDRMHKWGIDTLNAVLAPWRRH